MGLETADIITRLAQYGTDIATLAERGKQGRREHFIRMADAITKGFETEFDNRGIQDSIAKLDKFYNERGNKYDLESRDIYNTLKEKMTRQMNENVEFDTRMKEWEGFSETSEQFITDMYQYSSLDNDSQKLQFINRDLAYQDAIKNEELSPLVASRTNEFEKYEAWQTENMKKTISDYGAHVRNFGAKFYDRIPNSISMSMADTQFYMNDILKGFSQDGKIDDFEYQAWSGLVKNGDDQALQNLNSAKEQITKTQIAQTNNALTENVNAYNSGKNLLELGRVDVGKGEIELLFSGNAMPAHVAVGKGDLVTIPREWWLTKGQLNAIKNEFGEDSEQYRQALDRNKIASHFWEPIELKQIQLDEDIEKQNKILNTFGVYNSLDNLGYSGIKDKESEVEQKNIEELKKRAYKAQNKYKDLDVDTNFEQMSKTVDYIKSGYKDTNRLKWVKDITRKGDIETVKKSGRDRWYKEKLAVINGLIKQHGDNWAKAYNQGGYASTYGALPISVDKLYEIISLEGSNYENLDNLLELRKQQKGGN
jgi:hypothetical protein|tara:strand:+ start:403 stop:2016 length:1614 start_codon:yes stop_codon:yes gene_type:complete